MLILIVNSGLNNHNHMHVHMGSKKIFPTPGGLGLRMYVMVHAVHARVTGSDCESTNFQSGLEKFDIACDIDCLSEFPIRAGIF